MKIRPLEAEVLYYDGRTDRQTDIKEIRVVFKSFTKARVINRQTYIITTHRFNCHINLLNMLLLPTEKNLFHFVYAVS